MTVLKAMMMTAMTKPIAACCIGSMGIANTNPCSADKNATRMPNQKLFDLNMLFALLLRLTMIPYKCFTSHSLNNVRKTTTPEVIKAIPPRNPL